MKLTFFPKLAWTGVRKNRKLYVPYILSAIGMVTMFFILQAIFDSPLLLEMKGGGDLKLFLSLGRFVIAVFALLFLFYTNSFLIRRRYKEFGLYNILGMDKRSISRVVFWETLFVASIAVFGGTALGIALSKLAELGLLNMIHAEIDYRFSFSWESVGLTLGIFAVIFILLLLKALWQVNRAKPLELFRSENAGEKPPKANWVFAVVGVILLGAAYYMAVTIQSPLTAIVLFFVAVIMVIIATYLLFMSGSVALCRVLQKNKRYYYQKSHFVSVSSMAYRMKRNGAGLASICILCTMVLVMISSSGSLYIGAKETVRNRYPRNNEVSVSLPSLDIMADEYIAEIRGAYERVFAAHDFTPENTLEYRVATITGELSGEGINMQHGLNDAAINYDRLRELYFISEADYNAAMGTDIHLEPGTAMVHPLRCSFARDSIDMNGMELQIADSLDAYPEFGAAQSIIIPSLQFVVPDYETLRPLEEMRDEYGNRMLSIEYYYGYDVDDPDTAISVIRDQKDSLYLLDFLMTGDSFGYSFGCTAEEEAGFFAAFGGLFFLGIVLSIVFIFAAAMIIYYKQISEGYEDQSRFDIMQKVGMTKQDIKKSINSQVLTVFFAPLLFAGLHTGFAFPLVWKMLQLFGLQNLRLAVITTGGAFLIFGCFYALLYKATARAYYSIVSGAAARE